MNNYNLILQLVYLLIAECALPGCLRVTWRREDAASASTFTVVAVRGTTSRPISVHELGYLKAFVWL